MKKPPRKRNAGGVRAAGAGQNYSGSRIVAQATAPAQGRSFLVVVHGERVTAWGAYVRREDAEAIASKLRQSCGFVVSVVEAKP